MALKKRGNTWTADLTDPNTGRRIRKSLGNDYSTARKIYRQLMSDSTLGKFNLSDVKEIGFWEFSNKYMTQYSIPNKRSWKSTDLTYLNTLRPFFRDKLMHKISTEDIRCLVAERTGKVSPATINRFLALLKKMFNLAIEWGYCTSNPVTKVKMFKESNQYRFLTESDYVRLLDNCDERLRDVVEIAVNTGLRRQEIRDVKWTNVDFSTATLYIPRQKAEHGNNFAIPLNSRVMQIFLSVREQRDDEKPFDFNWRYSFNRAVKKAGLNIKFHDLRHTFATWVIKQTDIRTLKDLMRHADIKTTMRYTHLTDNSMKEAVSRLSHVTNRSVLST